MQGNSGVSRARLRQALRANVSPTPAQPHDLTGVVDGDVNFSEVGMNFTPDTGIVFVVDNATVEAAAVTSVVIVPSAKDRLGSIAVAITFSGVVGSVTNLFRMYLTGPGGQRSFLGSVSS